MIVFEQVGGNICRIEFENEEEKKALDKLLERKVKDYQSGLTLTNTVVFSDSLGVGLIPVGLVPWLIDNLSRKFQVVDKTYAPDDSKFVVDSSCFVNKDSRDYQINAAQELLYHDRGIMQAITGGGKSATLGAMIHSILRVKPEWKILVVGFTVDHWGQLLNTFREMDIPSQEIKAAKYDGSPVIVGRFDAFTRALDKGGEWEKVIRNAEVQAYDEVRHCSTADTYHEIFKRTNPVRVYGFDATPLKNFEDYSDPYKYIEDMNVVGYCGPIRISIGYNDLQKLGYLPLTYVNFIQMATPPQNLVDVSLKGIQITNNYTKIYKALIVHNDYRTSRFARLITNLAGSGKIVCFIKEHEHARRLMRMLMENDVESMAWFGNKKALAVSPNRGVYDAPFDTSYVRERFMEGNLPVVIGSSVLSEAISLDVATDAVNLAAGKTFSLSGQRAGRIMRTDKGRTPLVNLWDAFDTSHRVLRNQSENREAHYRATGLLINSAPCPELIYDLRKIGLMQGGISWNEVD